MDKIQFDELVAIIKDLYLNGTLTIGPDDGVVVPQRLKIVNTDAGMALVTTEMNSNSENYIAAFQKKNDTDHTYSKIGAMAFQFTDRDPTTGFASVNVHATKLNDSPSPDKFGWAFWAGHGMTIFPDDLTASDAPGNKVFEVKGELSVKDDATFIESGTFTKSIDNIYQAVIISNPNTGSNAVARLKIGNDTHISTFTIDVNGHNVSGRGDDVEIKNQLNARLGLGANGNITLYLNPDETIRAPGLAGSGTRALYVTSDGTLTV